MKKTFIIEKLIRDKLPEILRQNDVEVNLKTLSKDDFIASLKNKLIEEAAEVCEAKITDEISEECADLIEVVYSLLDVYNISIKEVETKRLQKKNVKGGFEGKTYNTTVTLDEGNKIFSLYKKYKTV